MEPLLGKRQRGEQHSDVSKARHVSGSSTRSEPANPVTKDVLSKIIDTMDVVVMRKLLFAAATGHHTPSKTLAKIMKTQKQYTPEAQAPPQPRQNVQNAVQNTATQVFDFSPHVKTIHRAFHRSYKPGTRLHNLSWEIVSETVFPTVKIIATEAAKLNTNFHTRVLGFGSLIRVAEFLCELDDGPLTSEIYACFQDEENALTEAMLAILNSITSAERDSLCRVNQDGTIISVRAEQISDDGEAKNILPGMDNVVDFLKNDTEAVRKYQGADVRENASLPVFQFQVQEDAVPQSVPGRWNESPTSTYADAQERPSSHPAEPTPPPVQPQHQAPVYPGMNTSHATALHQPGPQYPQNSLQTRPHSQQGPQGTIVNLSDYPIAWPFPAPSNLPPGGDVRLQIYYRMPASPYYPSA
jgi:hypothetical protein